MNGVNKVIIVGTLGKDPEVKYMPNGTAVCNATFATSEQWNDKQTGEKKERTEWHRITFYGRLAEVMGNYMKKGSKAYIEGKLQTRDYEKEGQKHYITEILVDEMQMLGGKPNGSQERPAQARPSQQPEAAQGDFVDDDIPF